MNLQEFAALKVGDKIENAMTQSVGKITEVTGQGVRIAWGSPTAHAFLYTVQSTAWFHWSKVPSSIGEAVERGQPGNQL